MGNPLTTAYAGHADITEANVKALLDQFLPQDPPEGDGLGLVFIPERVIRAQKGLKTTIAWLETELGGPESTIPVEDLIAEMLKRKEAEGDDLTLFLLFDPENEDDVALANAANDAGIPIRNLAGAGDFLVFEQPEPEAPAVEVPPWEEPAEVAAAEARSEALAAIVAPTTGVTININIPAAAIDALARAIVERMANLGAAQVAAQGNGEYPASVNTEVAAKGDKPAEPTGRTESFPGAVAGYYHAENGTWRKARGMAKPGETKYYLTEDEAKSAFAQPTGPRSRSGA